MKNEEEKNWCPQKKVHAVRGRGLESYGNVHNSIIICSCMMQVVIENKGEKVLNGGSELRARFNQSPFLSRNKTKHSKIIHLPIFLSNTYHYYFPRALILMICIMYCRQGESVWTNEDRVYLAANYIGD